MKIIFAKNIGFCYGVKRAVAIAEKSLKNDSKPVQFLGNLVHNESVLKDLMKKGGRVVSNLSRVNSGTLIIKAHGISPVLKKTISQDVTLRDTTCPLVRRVHLKTRALLKQGYQVIIIGDKNHSETKGILGFTEGTGRVIKDESQAKKLKMSKKLGVVSQTTQNLDKFNKILKILKKKTKKLKWFNTICPEVSRRQKELSQILKKADGILLIGSHSSANTGRLAEIVKKSKKPLWWINSLKELKKIKFKNVNTLGVVSGTSAPNREIEKVKKYLNYLK